MTSTFHSPGKLLLTGEYVVLDGAKALAIPTSYGQSMEVSPTSSGNVEWYSKDKNGNIWFEAVFDILNLNYFGVKNAIAETLQEILREARKLNPSFLTKSEGYLVNTQLSFPRDWGLGTSSTLINNIAQWAQVNAHELLTKSFGGSGYDIAVAQYRKPIIYQLRDGNPQTKAILLPWKFTDHLFFIYLNQKQDSKKGISHYQNTAQDKTTNLDLISEITQEISQCNSLNRFTELLSLHENIISSIIKLPTIKEQLFSDFKGTIKSLGAWGGDFALVAVDKTEDLSYFKDKGYHTIIPFHEMIP